MTAPFYGYNSGGQEAGPYGGSIMHMVTGPQDGYHAATGYLNLGGYADDSCSISGYVDNVPNTTPVDIDAFSGSNTLQNGTLTIRQDDELELQVLADGPLVCSVYAGDASADVDIAAGSNGTGHRFPAYAFDVGITWVSATCPGADPNGFELEVLTPINPPSTSPPAAITSASITTLGNVNLNGQSFTSDTPVKVAWTTTNATACYLRRWNIQQYPTQNTGTVVPEGHFDVGDYEFSFFCVGDGGVSDTVVLEFEVLAPSGNPATDPGFRGEYEATIGNVNNDGKSDIRIKPASSNTDTGVAEFVLVSNPTSPGYQVLGPQSISWGSVSTAIDLLMGDFDADGLEDMIIKNLSGADDVIVYAPRLATGRPRDYVEVDEQFLTFFEELYGQIVDPDYFANNTYEDVEDHLYWLDYDAWGPCSVGFEWSTSYFAPTACSMPMLFYDWGLGWDWIGMSMPIPIWERTVRLYRIYRLENGDPDYRDFHPATNGIRGVFRNDFNTGILQTGEIEAGSWQAQNLMGALSSVLKRPYMMGALLETGITLPFEAAYPVSLESGRLAKFTLTMAMILGPLIDHIDICTFLSGGVGLDAGCTPQESFVGTSITWGGDMSISPQEQLYADNGDRESFWSSRLLKGDPVAPIALQIVRNEWFLGKATNYRLQLFLDKIYEAGGPQHTLDDVGVALMRSHILEVIQDVGPPPIGHPGALSVEQLDQYHNVVFKEMGIPVSAYGGNMFWGMVPGGLYCASCE